MSEEDGRIPEPAEEDTGLSPNPFEGLTAEPISMEFPGDPSDSDIGDFAAPNYKATKPKWWQRGKRINERDNPKNAKPRKPMPTMAPTALHRGLMDFYNGMAFMLMPMQPEIAMAISSSAEKCADAWVELSRTNPAVKRFLIGLVTTSATGALIFAHMPIIMITAVTFVPGLKEKQEKTMADFAERMSAGIPTTEDEK